MSRLALVASAVVLIASVALDGARAAPASNFSGLVDIGGDAAQAKLAGLVPHAEHITRTHSGHEIPKVQPQLVIGAIREVVDAVRDGRNRLIP